MPAPTTPQYLPRNVQEGLIQYHRTVSTIVDTQWNLREQMRKIDIAYIREQDDTIAHRRAQISNDVGDSDKIQNVTIPVIKPQINSAVAYQCAVFCSSYPIFPIVAPPQYEDAALQMQALLEENSIRGGWARELMLFFYDAFKYPTGGILEVTWDKIVTAAIETDITYKNGQEGRPKELVWAGNCLRRWDPYNTYFDTRVIPYDLPTKGEFAGRTELMSKTALKMFLLSLESKQINNIPAAFNSPSMLGAGDSGTWGASYYVPRINPNVLQGIDPQNTVDWMAWAGLGANKDGISFKGLYEVSTEYIRIIPSEFSVNWNVPERNTPQIWKLIIVNHSVVVYAERQTNAHEKIPVFFGQACEDGLGYQSKSLAEEGKPFQQTASALMNSVLASRRRAITDRMLYDPSRVTEAHINNPNPSAKIPVRPSAYGKPVGEAVFQFPFRDDQAQIAMQEIQTLVAFGNVLNGQNPARQGQFVKGNKTDGQWDSVMSNATSKDQLTSLLFEAQTFTPLKEVLKFNYLQYQGGTTLYSDTQRREVKVDPLALRAAVMTFKITDGFLPAEKVISGDSLKVAMQVIGSSEALAAGYNIGPMFSYLLKTENADLTAFEKSPQQIAYEQAMGQWSQLAQLAIQKGAQFNVPQPLPQQYGFDPAAMNPATPATQATPTQQPVQGAQ
jgi:hypothetical protein